MYSRVQAIVVSVILSRKSFDRYKPENSKLVSHLVNRDFSHTSNLKRKYRFSFAKWNKRIFYITRTINQEKATHELKIYAIKNCFAVWSITAMFSLFISFTVAVWENFSILTKCTQGNHCNAFNVCSCDVNEKTQAKMFPMNPDNYFKYVKNSESLKLICCEANLRF